MGKLENYIFSWVFYNWFQIAQPRMKPQGTEMGIEAEGGEGSTLSSD